MQINVLAWKGRLFCSSNSLILSVVIFSQICAGGNNHFWSPVPAGSVTQRNRRRYTCKGTMMRKLIVNCVFLCVRWVDNSPIAARNQHTLTQTHTHTHTSWHHSINTLQLTESEWGVKVKVHSTRSCVRLRAVAVVGISLLLLLLLSLSPSSGCVRSCVVSLCYTIHPSVCQFLYFFFVSFFCLSLSVCASFFSVCVCVFVCVSVSRM